MDGLLDFIGEKRTNTKAEVASEEFKGKDLPTKRAKRQPNIIYNDGDVGAQIVNTFQSKLVARQQKGRKIPVDQLTKEQRKIEMLAKMNDPTFNRLQQKRSVERRHKLAKDEEESTRELLVEMAYANDQDHNTINEVMQGQRSSNQAMHRFQLLGKISELLRRKGIQNQFLELGGCQLFEKWLMQNPDGSYPPYQVVEQVFEVLESLPIEIDHLQNCSIAKVLQLYACDKAQLGQAIASRATHLLQRWQVTVYQLSYEYDEEGLHELRHRELKRKLEVLRDIDPAELKGSSKDDATMTLKDDELIRKAPNGTFIMHKSNFDFLEKPESFDEEAQSLLAEARAKNKRVTKVQFGDQKPLSAKATISRLVGMQKKIKNQAANRIQKGVN